MNNKTIVWIVVAVVVVGAVVWFAMGRSSSPGMGTYGTTQSGAGSMTSLKDLFASGQSQKCTFTNTAADGMQSNGTIYVSSGHMRGDFTAQTANGTMMSHMITDGTTSWVWTDASGGMAAQGMKMSFAASASSTTTGGSGSQQAQAVDPNAQMNYSCNGWSPDQSEFALPANITFTDMTAMMQNMNGMKAGAGASGNAALCSQCNAIPSASAKAQCLAALGCK